MRVFTCGLCGVTFDSDPDFTEAAACAELKQHFGNIRPEERASVCEDCFQKMHPEQHPHLVEEAVAETLRARE